MKIKIKKTGEIVEVAGPASTDISEGLTGGWRLKNGKVIPYDDCIILSAKKKVKKEIWKKRKNIRKWVIENIDVALEDKFLITIVKKLGYKNTFKEGLRWMKNHLEKEIK